MRRTFFVALALGLMTGLGCATALNVQNDSLRKPYGGVTMPLFEFCGGNQSTEHGALVLFPFWLLDKPLSLLADTLTLPYTLWPRQDSPPPANTYPPLFNHPSPGAN